MFIPSNYLEKSLENYRKNKNYETRRAVVASLIGYINADQAFETDDFDSAIQYALQHGISRNDLFQPYDTSKNKIDNNRSNWDESYYALTKVRLKANFCQERIDHCKEVAHFIYHNGLIKNDSVYEKELPKDFINLVKQNKTDDVRKEILNLLKDDDTTRGLYADPALKYAFKKGVFTFDKHNGEKLETDKNKWDKEYLDRQIEKCVTNFSKERFNHIKKVIDTVIGVSSYESIKAFSENLQEIINNINVMSKSESSVIKEIQSLKKDKDIEIKNVSKAVSYIEKQYSNILKKYSNLLKLNTNKD